MFDDDTKTTSMQIFKMFDIKLTTVDVANAYRKIWLDLLQK